MYSTKTKLFSETEIRMELCSLIPETASLFPAVSPTGAGVAAAQRAAFRKILQDVDAHARIVMVGEPHLFFRLLNEMPEKVAEHSGHIFIAGMDPVFSHAYFNILQNNVELIKADTIKKVAPDFIIVQSHTTLNEPENDFGSATVLFLDEETESHLLFEKQKQVDHLATALHELNPDILYVGNFVYFNFSRQSIPLQAKGKKTALLVASPENLQHKHGDFDGIFSYWHDTQVLFSVLRTLPAHCVIHVQGWFGFHWLPVFIKAAAPSVRVICEFNDMPSACLDGEILSRLWGEDARQLEEQCEHAIHHLVDGLIYNLSKEGAEKKHLENNSSLPFINFHSYPLSKYYSTPSPLSRQVHSPVRLVFCGSLAPSYHPKAVWGDVCLLPLFEKLIQSGFSVDVYGLPYQGMNRPEFLDYQYLMKSNENFRLHEGLSPAELGNALVGYDFGMMFYDFSETLIQDEHKKYLLPTKLFSFIEAGIPVIISAEMEYVASIIQEHGLGFAVSREEVQHPELIYKKICAADIGELRKNIVHYRNTHGMESAVDEVLGLYDAAKAVARSQPRMEQFLAELRECVAEKTPLALSPWIPDRHVLEYFTSFGVSLEGLNIQCVLDNMPGLHSRRQLAKIPVLPRNSDVLSRLLPETRFLVWPCYVSEKIVRDLGDNLCVPKNRILYPGVVK